MIIQRTGDCPQFLDYIVKQAVVPHVGPLSEEFNTITTYGFRWIEIPSYQRGLVWDEEKLQDLLESDSVFLGNAVLGKFPLPHRDTEPFSLLPKQVTHYEVLIDGLQRFSIGTALLNILYDLVLKAEPDLTTIAPRFAGLRTQTVNLAPVFQHNRQQLRNHAKRGLRESYIAFEATLRKWVRSELEMPARSGDRTDQLIRLFLGRQIAPDTYHGFVDEYDVTNTFIGLNTTRVQLHVVDWLRSIIIDMAGRAGWTPGQIGEIENQFSDTFYSTDGASPLPELEPVASIIKDCLVRADRRACVFPSAATGLQFDEVERFLEFVAQFRDHDTDPYVSEIRETGALPFASIICYYYRLFLELGTKPGFFDGESAEKTELRPFLRAMYRVLLDGRVGRTRLYAERLLTSKAQLTEIAEEISRNFLSRELSQPVDAGWLLIALRKCDRRRSQRVFNACLLPAIEHDEGEFIPQRFGRDGTCFQIDHLIPKTTIKKNSPGSTEAESIVNYAPILGSTNNAQNHLRCSEKLAPGGTYAREVELADVHSHPYVAWLVETQGPSGMPLDWLPFLEMNAENPIGDRRLEWICESLVARL
jgi:hypothetical protein